MCLLSSEPFWFKLLCGCVSHAGPLGGHDGATVQNQPKTQLPKPEALSEILKLAQIIEFVSICDVLS